MKQNDFEKLKYARHKLQNYIAKNNLEDSEELKEVMRLLNAIHSNNSFLEKEIK